MRVSVPQPQCEAAKLISERLAWVMRRGQDVLLCHKLAGLDERLVRRQVHAAQVAADQHRVNGLCIGGAA